MPADTYELPLQVCDGDLGCGHVIRDNYVVPQRCDWRRHPGYSVAGSNAPLMRPTTATVPTRG